jgi:peptide/nickel transport system permease protein
MNAGMSIPPEPESDGRLSADDAMSQEKRYLASQWRLMWWKFVDHRLALCSMYLLCLFYFVALFCEFFAPHNPRQRARDLSFAPPQRVHLVHEGRLRGPFVYPRIQHFDQELALLTYTEDRSRVQPIRFFVRGDTYRFWGLVETSVHLVGLRDGGRLYLMGADRLGRDLFSRILYGSRISLSLGLVGVFLSLVLGIVIGGISGYFGGITDTVIQRFIEILMSIPSIPLWMALAAAVPPTWSQLTVYFCMTTILALIGWTGVAREVRGKILALREEDYAMAARAAGVKEFRILMRHLVPGFTSHLIVVVTLAIPAMILAETALSFLQLGLRAPTISWGVLLQDAMNLQAVNLYPWLIWPTAFVVFVVLLFNFLGDGLRDAADPYRH